MKTQKFQLALVLFFLLPFAAMAQSSEDERTDLEKRKKEILSKMTMNAIEYYRGASAPTIADIRIVYGNRDITYHNVVLSDESFFPDFSILPNAYASGLANFDIVTLVKDTTEPYYSIKYFRFLESFPALALGVDFIHFKVFITDFDQHTYQTGTINGKRISRYRRIGDDIDWFSVSHGVNHLTFTALYRLMLLKTEEIPDGMIQPFVGVGFGPALPHGELSLKNPDGSNTRKMYGYIVEFPNFGFDLTLGVRFKFSPNFTLNLVYKYTHTWLGNLPFDNPDEGHVEISFPDNHLQWGLAFCF